MRACECVGMCVCSPLFVRNNHQLKWVINFTSDIRQSSSRQRQQMRNSLCTRKSCFQCLKLMVFAFSERTNYKRLLLFIIEMLLKYLQRMGRVAKCGPHEKCINHLSTNREADARAMTTQSTHTPYTQHTQAISGISTGAHGRCSHSGAHIEWISNR